MAIVTTRWDGMRWTRQRQAHLAPDEALSAYGQVVWFWRRDAGAKSAGAIPPATVTTSPLHREEHEVSRKTIAQGMSECFRFTCMLVCAKCATFWHTRPRVQRAPGIPCALHFSGGTTRLENSGKSCREIVTLRLDRKQATHSLVIARAGGRSSIPEAVVIEPRSRGVLDPPHPRG